MSFRCPALLAVPGHIMAATICIGIPHATPSYSATGCPLILPANRGPASDYQLVNRIAVRRLAVNKYLVELSTLVLMTFLAGLQRAPSPEDCPVYEGDSPGRKPAEGFSKATTYPFGSRS